MPSSYNLVLKKVIDQGHLFKLTLRRHDRGLVKVYFKHGDSIDLKNYESCFFQMKDIFCALHTLMFIPSSC
ncbi:hypothetical protein CIPAW_04G155500 [Carya illinoinensis]|uniref:Uncharacterized protein n=1 Tax=Carya illinoinensis TaxID=32201 RepID=A0A8T1QV44_CARIL|nr:hypothetical protein CIPAW_04G155500 [Carya illinoinensis]KAG6658357.1 hypothetical protein CIPAW_04G155500 [Carya illinoinensis]